MQKILLMFLVLYAPAAFGRYVGPYVVKTSATGFVMPEATRIETCELFHDKVVIKRQFGQGNAVTETRALTFEGSLMALAEEASRETVKEEPSLLCDAPMTRVHAVRVLPTDAVEEVPLFATGGCGSNSLVREGGVSMILRHMIDQFCPTTYVNGGE